MGVEYRPERPEPYIIVRPFVGPVPTDVELECLMGEGMDRDGFIEAIKAAIVEKREATGVTSAMIYFPDGSQCHVAPEQLPCRAGKRTPGLTVGWCISLKKGGSCTGCRGDA